MYVVSSGEIQHLLFMSQTFTPVSAFMLYISYMPELPHVF